MGVASWLVWKQGSPAANRALSVYAAQLVFNLAWTPLFFKAHRLDLALADTSLLLASSIATTAAFYRVSPAAGIIFSPLVPWVAFATALNKWILDHNPNAHELQAEQSDDLGLLVKGGNQTDE